ncbi:MAG: SpoVR family protein [Gammaproteobacteria bacterium]|nr:SpoVR family protein [Gammaproteobacteria bacterium]HXK55481.1 SpoVR family protein [Gammaproteobacteria bacterium]
MSPVSPDNIPGEPISTSSDWTFELIERFNNEIGLIAKDEYGLDCYPVQLELISSEQMMDAYASVGMPIGYHHWSFGKQFVISEHNYKRGQMNLAYEIVINSNPCIAYLMEENTLTMQALVIAHAAYGHNSFFKGNYLFKLWTDAEAIIDYLIFAKNYVTKCEERYGVDAVELLLDSCHALMNIGVDRYKRKSRGTLQDEEYIQSDREKRLQHDVHELWQRLGIHKEQKKEENKVRFPAEPQENVLYFIEKNAPLLESWQREIVRIVRKIAQYFYPQRQTQVMNEGWACFWHHTLMNRLYDKRLVNDSSMLEFIHTHSNVIAQPGFDSRFYSGINPYALGFKMMTDIKRICENPDNEDREWFPDIAGSDWHETLDFAMRNFKDESFIGQYLSPKIIREFRFFSIMDDDAESSMRVTGIHNTRGYENVRAALSNQYDLGNMIPNLQIYNVDHTGDRTLTLRHYVDKRRPLADSTREVLKHLHRLWGFKVQIESVDEKGGSSISHSCPEA